MVQVITNLDLNQRALRALQAPEHVQWDPADNHWRVSSAAFAPQSDGTISVDLEEAQRRDSLPLTHGYPPVDRAVGLVAHTVARLESDGFKVTHVPVEGNDYHGQAAGSPSKGKRRTLAKECEIISAIDGDEAQRQENEKLAREAQKAATPSG